jgi:hypothetical protein
MHGGVDIELEVEWSRVKMENTLHINTFVTLNCFIGLCIWIFMVN